MSNKSTPSHRQPLTFTEVARHYNEPGESFPILCPVCGHHADCSRRRLNDGISVVCDNGCPRKKIIRALTTLIRNESITVSQDQLMRPFPAAPQPPGWQDLPGAAQNPAPLARDGAPSGTVADGDEAIGEIIVIGNASESQSPPCRHLQTSLVGAPDNGDWIPRCRQCRAMKPHLHWLFWKWGVGWYMRKNPASMKSRYDPSTGSMQRVEMNDIEKVPVCAQCRGTVQVRGQCLFCTYPGLTFSHAT